MTKSGCQDARVARIHAKMGPIVNYFLCVYFYFFKLCFVTDILLVTIFDDHKSLVGAVEINHKQAVK